MSAVLAVLALAFGPSIGGDFSCAPSWDGGAYVDCTLEPVPAEASAPPAMFFVCLPKEPQP